MVGSTLFRTMAAMLGHVWLGLQQFQLWCMTKGLEQQNPSLSVECPNAVKARTIQKILRLHALKKLVELAQDIERDRPIQFLHELFLNGTEYRFSFLTSRLQYPPELQRALL